MVTSAPAAYALCWTPDAATADYDVNLAPVLVTGVFADTASTCVFGLPCSVRVAGVGLATTDGVRRVCASKAMRSALLVARAGSVAFKRFRNGCPELAKWFHEPSGVVRVAC